MRRALAIDERNFGSEHPEVATSLYRLAELIGARRTEAVSMLRRALAIDEKGLGPSHPQVARDLTKLADALYHNDDDDPDLEAEAWKLVWRALTIVETTDDPAVAERLRELGRLMINMIPATGNPADWRAKIEALYRRALAIDEQALGCLHPTIVDDHEALSVHLDSDKRFAEAEPLRRRTVAILDQSMGPEHFDVAVALDALAKLLRRTNRSAEAVPLQRRVLAIETKHFGPDSSVVVLGSTKLADALREMKELPEAEAIYRRVLEIESKKPYPDPHATISLLEGLTQILIDSQRWADAEPLVRRMLTLHEKGTDPVELKIAADVSNLAVIDGALGDWTSALAQRRRLSGIFFRHRWPLMTNPRQDGVSYRDAFRGHVLAIRKALPIEADGLAESFRMAQWALENDTAGAVEQMSARIAAGSDQIAELLRERQVASRERAAIGNIHKVEFGAFGKIDERLRANLDRLRKEFPSYLELEEPQPLSIEEAQSLLTDDEALIQFLEVRPAGAIPSEGYFAWVVTKRQARWLELGITPSAVAQQVQALRCGLDATLWQDAVNWPDDSEDERRERADQMARRQRCVGLLGVEPITETLKVGTTKRNVEFLPFDVAAAHSLYKVLLGPFEDMIKGKRLIVIPDGALTSLPFNVLVTAPPRARIPTALADFGSTGLAPSRQSRSCRRLHH
jgi:tetratricopeptide (TPR) repeat protein